MRLVLGSSLPHSCYTTDEKQALTMSRMWNHSLCCHRFFSFCVFRNETSFHHLTFLCAPVTLSHHAILQTPCTFMTVRACMPTLVLPGITSPVSASRQFLLILVGPTQTLPPLRSQSSMDFP